MSEFYDRAGDPIGLEQWGRLKQSHDYSIVARDEVGGYLVSTVWLGLDHSFGFGRPLIFETMVFGGDDGDERETRRYSTEDEARAGHAEILNVVQLFAQISEPVE